MIIAEINTCTYGSTGKIMLNIAQLVNQQGGKSYVCVPNGRHNNKKNFPYDCVFIGNRFSEDFHLLLDRFTGLNGCFSFFATLRFIKKLQKLKPDIIHLHNLHNCYINLPLFFSFLKKSDITVVWTLHDCWAFTGHCPHFTLAKCDKWKYGCKDCPQHMNYPKSFVDNSKYMYNYKKKWFSGVKNLTIVTPSRWLASLVKESFLKDYPIKVINNGIDLSVFKPIYSDFRKKYDCENKFIVLGVAFGWNERKGLDVFVELSKRLGDNYKIVLVGTNEKIDRKLPSSIISIHKTQDQTELAEIYSAADLFVNPTREDNFPTVNMEALACGTPVLTFRTGGSPEVIDKTCGCVVQCDDIGSMEFEIRRAFSQRPYCRYDCLEKSKSFDMNDRFQEYIALYSQLLD